MDGKVILLDIQRQARFGKVVSIQFYTQRVSGCRKGRDWIFQPPGIIHRDNLYGYTFLPGFTDMDGGDQCKGMPVPGLTFEIPAFKIRTGFVFSMEILLHNITKRSIPGKAISQPFFNIEI